MPSHFAFHRACFLLVLVAFGLLCAVPTLHAESPRVLVVHSYHEGQQEHVVDMTRGIEEALEGPA